MAAIALPVLDILPECELVTPNQGQWGCESMPVHSLLNVSMEDAASS